jgi:hypothetical protein
MIEFDQIDNEIRGRSYTQRAVNEENKNGEGYRSNLPVRRKDESPSYWHLRELAYKIAGMYYRTPQFNVELLRYCINELVEPNYFIRSANFAVGRNPQVTFETRSGSVKFDPMLPIDSVRFLARFGLVPKSH